MALPRRQLANLRLLVICIFLLRSGLAAGRYTDSSGILKQNDHLRLRRRFYDRTLQSSGTPYRVELVLALQYLNDTVASEIESSITIPSNDDAFHFCKSVNHQVSLIHVCESS